VRGARFLRHDRRGFALVLTLVVTALMVAVAAELVHQVYVDMSLSRGFRDGQQAALLAESGVGGGAKLLQLVLGSQEYTSLSDKWAAPLKLDDEAGQLEIAAMEESARINLNLVVLDEFTLKALKRLGKKLEIPEPAWDALVDWVDTDDQPRTDGAESPYYQRLNPPYSARNGQLASLQELTLIKGFTPEIIAKLRPFVTVHSGIANAPLSKINVNTAPKEVLYALDDRIDDAMAERILEERRLRPFKNPAELARVPGFEAIAPALQGRISVQGTLFRIVSQAHVGESGRTVEAVVRLAAGGRPEVVSWQEY